MFVRGVAEIAEVNVALNRLRAFLMLEEKGAEKKPGLIVGLDSTEKKKQPKPPRRSLVDNNIMIVAKNATARWTTESPNEPKKKDESAVKNSDSEQTIYFKPPTLENLTFKCEKGSLIGVIGAVGAGKSSLLQMILRELPLESGEIQVNGSVSYAPQEAWVFAASVRQNILFGLDYEKAHYDNVVKACCLLPDFEQFQFGDQTVIGERGASLSGGQKARVSLARAMYRTSDIYLLDDPLSAVDAHVGRHLFDEVIGPKNKLCKRQTRVLVTHQVHFLKDADWLVVLKDGVIEMQGKPDVLFKEAADLEKYLSVMQEEEDIGDDEEDDLNESGVSRKSSNKSSRKSSVGSLKLAEKKKNEEKQQDIGEQMNLEKSSKNQVQGNLFLQYMRAGGNAAGVGVVLLLFVVTQFLASGFDWFVAFWTRQEEYWRLLESETGVESRQLNNTVTNDTVVEMVTQQQQEGIVEENWIVFDTNTCVYIQGALIGSLFVIGMIRAISFYTVAMRASAKLHSEMFKSIVSTKMR